MNTIMRLFMLPVLVAVAAAQYTGPLPWNLDRLDQQDLPLDGKYEPIGDTHGNLSIVYVISTGVDWTHENLKNFTRVRLIYDFEGTDTDGCGTALAGIIGGDYTGVAKEVHLGIVRVAATCSIFNLNTIHVVEGMSAVINDYKSLKAVDPVSHRRGVAVSQMSYPLTTNWLAHIEELTRDMYREGILVVGPVGDDVNFGAFDCTSLSPGRMYYEPGIIIVGGSTKNDKRHPNSIVGGRGAVHCAHIYAPGHEVISSVPGNNYAVIQANTAYAAAHVAGAAARLRTICPELTPFYVKDSLITGSLAHGVPCLDLDDSPLPANLLRVPHRSEPAECTQPARR